MNTAKVETVAATPDIPASAGELVAAGASIMRLENTTQMSIAVQRPRDEAKILAAALRTLDLYPSMAEEAIYARPVGRDDKGNEKLAEGLSIRAAEDLANRWGNNAFGVEIVSENEEGATIAAVYLDFETNARRAIQKKVSRFYKSRGGQIVQHPPDRFADVVIPKNISVTLREIVLRSLPAGLKKEYEAKARGILSKDKVGRMRNALTVRFEEAGIDLARPAAHVGKEVGKWNREDCIRLLGMVNAIRDGEASADEMFGPMATTAPAAQGGLPLNVKGSSAAKDTPSGVTTA